MKYLRDNLVQGNCGLGNMFDRFLKESFLIDDIGTLPELKLLLWLYHQWKKLQRASFTYKWSRV